MPEQSPELLSLVEKEDFPERHLRVQRQPHTGTLREGALGKVLQMQ